MSDRITDYDSAMRVVFEASTCLRNNITWGYWDYDQDDLAQILAVALGMLGATILFLAGGDPRQEDELWQELALLTQPGVVRDDEE